MSRWEQERVIEARIIDGELMLSASDVTAWLHDCAPKMRPICFAPAAEALADKLTDLIIEGTRPYIDGGES